MKNNTLLESAKTNNNPFPIRLGELRGHFENEARSSQKSIHFMIKKALKDHVKRQKNKVKRLLKKCTVA